MISYLLSLPRASWTWRVVALIFLVSSFDPLMKAWGYVHDDLKLVRGYGWWLLFINTCMLPAFFIIGVLGRMPKSMQPRKKGLNRTLSQIHADIAQEQQDLREKSREL